MYASNSSGELPTVSAPVFVSASPESFRGGCSLGAAGAWHLAVSPDHEFSRNNAAAADGSQR